MKTNPVGWFEIYVDNMPRAKKFYEDVFTSKLAVLPNSPNSGNEIEMVGFPMDMKAMGSAGALAKMPGFKPGGNSVIVYFKSDDCEVEQKRVLTAGGKIQRPKTSIGEYGFITIATDTEGNMFGIHSEK